MVNVNAKTPNKKRKGLVANAEGSNTQTPKKPKPIEGTKTLSGKTKTNAATPANGNKTPKAIPQQNAAKTPKPTPKVNQEQKPSPGQKPIKREKKSSESESPGSPKKLKMFSGTAELGNSKDKKVSVKNENKAEKKGKNKNRRYNFVKSIKEKLNSGDKTVLKDLEEKIKSFESRKELSKTAIRKLKVLQKLKRGALGEKATPPTVSQKRRERKKNAKAKHEAEENKQVDTKPTKANKQKPTKKAVAVKKGEKEEEKDAELIKGNQQKPIKKGALVKKEDKDDEEESSDYEVETEVTPGKILKTEVEAEEEEESGEEEEEEGDEDEESGEEEEVEGEEADADEDSDEEEEEDSEEEDESEEVENKTGKKPQPKQVHAPDLKSLEENQIINKKQKRYVLFVGNLPYDATKEEISEHFKKAGDVRHIRIPLDKQTSKPRGFAYVELDNEIAYQKGLSLHHTFIKGRRINVLYTTGGKKKGEVKKNEVKAKNLKLQAMRKQGQLAGSVKENQKRSARRAKKNAVKATPNGS